MLGKTRRQTRLETCQRWDVVHLDGGFGSIRYVPLVPSVTAQCRT